MEILQFQISFPYQLACSRANTLFLSFSSLIAESNTMSYKYRIVIRTIKIMYVKYFKRGSKL